ncbi:MAG TPA: response regulator [Anaeromyxobacteraceae bacterium]|nr:response regulator [Anaeromyxobacteraceae bacterium]
MLSVLIAEDDTDIRSALASILRSEGYRVVSACDGREALDLLRGGLRPDVILLDLMMPVMTGAEFRTAQLADPALAHIPVVVLSADGRFREAGRLLGAAEAFAKPFDVAALLSTIERVGRAPRRPAVASA